MTHALQVTYREDSKQKIARQLEIAGKTATDEELEQMLEVSNLTRTDALELRGNFYMDKTRTVAPGKLPYTNTCILEVTHLTRTEARGN